MTWEEIKDYVRYEKRQCETREVGSYESQPFPTDRPGGNGGREECEDTCIISVHLLGDDEHGYILVTEDDADGPSDDLGRDVYPSVEAALNEMAVTADRLPFYGHCAA